MILLLHFQALLDDTEPKNPTEEDFKNAERFLALQYGSSKLNLDEVRVTTLLLHEKPEESTPNSNAAKWHICRAFCQAARLKHASLQYHNEHLPSSNESGSYSVDEEGTLCTNNDDDRAHACSPARDCHM